MKARIITALIFYALVAERAASAPNCSFPGPAVISVEEQGLKINVGSDNSGRELSASIVLPSELTPQLLILSNPARIVVDIPGNSFKMNKSFSATKKGLLSKLRLGSHPDKLRMVFDIVGAQEPKANLTGSGKTYCLSIIQQSSETPISSSTPQALAAPSTSPVSLASPLTTPSLVPTSAVTLRPTSAPTASPTNHPTYTPTPAPTKLPTPQPTPTKPSPTVAPVATPVAATPTPSKLVEAATHVATPMISLSAATASSTSAATPARAAANTATPALTLGDLEPHPTAIATAVPHQSIPPTNNVNPNGLTPAPSAEPSVAPSPEPTREDPNAPPTVTAIEFVAASDSEPAFIRLRTTKRCSYKIAKRSLRQFQLILKGARMVEPHLFLPHYPPQDVSGFTHIVASPHEEGIAFALGVDQGVRLSAHVESDAIVIQAQLQSR